jgi:hypothetical protein
VVFYQTPGLEVTACVLLSTKAVYFVLHDGLRRYFSEPLQGRHWAWGSWCMLWPAEGQLCGLRQQGVGCSGLSPSSEERDDCSTSLLQLSRGPKARCKHTMVRQVLGHWL